MYDYVNVYALVLGLWDGYCHQFVSAILNLASFYLLDYAFRTVYDLIFKGIAIVKNVMLDKFYFCYY